MKLIEHMRTISCASVGRLKASDADRFSRGCRLSRGGLCFSYFTHYQTRGSVPSAMTRERIIYPLNPLRADPSAHISWISMVRPSVSLLFAGCAPDRMRCVYFQPKASHLRQIVPGDAKQNGKHARSCTLPRVVFPLKVLFLTNSSSNYQTIDN